MPLKIFYIFFLCALGVFNCFWVSLYFLGFPSNRRVPNTLFGLLTFLLSIRVGKTLIMYFDRPGHLWLAQIGLSACFLIGLALYCYLKAALEERGHIPLSWRLHFGLLCLIILLFGLWKPYPYHEALWANYVVWGIYLSWGVYHLLAAYVLRRQLQAFFTTPQDLSTLHTWLVLVYWGSLLIFISYLVGYFWLYLVEMLTFSFVFYVLGIYFLSRKDRDSIFYKSPEKYARKKITSSEAQSLEARLEELMHTEELYKNPDLKLLDVSSQLHISPHKLSQFLNENLGEGFSTYINRYRVEKAIQLLKENKIYTLEAIGYASGFTSKSGFYATFKKVTGHTPSHFRKQFH